MAMRLPALILACGCVTLTAAASPPFLDGAYGNKEGCHYSKTDDSSGADVLFLLNDEGVTTATAYCEFKSPAEKMGSGFSITAQCDAEGEVGTVNTVRLDRSAKGYTVRFDDGTTWGPLAKCR